MKLGFLMIILTLGEGGDPSAAFVNTDTLAECEQRAGVVRNILEGGDISIEKLVCLRSEAAFEPFSHGMDGFAEPQTYLLSMTDETATVTQVDACEGAAADVLCVTSNQKLLSQNP